MNSKILLFEGADPKIMGFLTTISEGFGLQVHPRPLAPKSFIREAWSTDKSRLRIGVWSSLLLSPGKDGDIYPVIAHGCRIVLVVFCLTPADD